MVLNQSTEKAATSKALVRRPIVAGNWKMNLTWAASTQLAQTISNECLGLYNDIDIVLCPPFTSIKGVANVVEFDKAQIKVGTQDVCEVLPEGTAAYTGEISVEMLKDLGCDYCIIGHSERRAAFGETDELVNRKAKLLLQHGIVPIVCCGESEEVNQNGQTKQFVSEQIKLALDGIAETDAKNVVVAYEPIWAIGTGKVPTPDAAESTCLAIRDVVGELYGVDTAESVRILYGGSMKPENAKFFLSEKNIDGGLIGGAALVASKFVDIIKTCEEVLHS